MAVSDLLSRGWFCVFFFVLRPFIKWFLRRLTGRCELLRITYDHKEGYVRTKAIERCLELSKCPAIRSLAFDSHVDIGAAVSRVMDIKDIKPEVHASFEPRFSTCLEQLMGYRELLEHVDVVRRTPYDDQNEEHERKLLQLWRLLEPERPLSSRVSKQWQDVGFQGDDPKTDFRGMGILGLDNLVYFLSHHPDEAREVYSHSHHPKYGYSFAIVGINLTAEVYELLCERRLTRHLYNSVHAKPQLQHFNAIYCHIFYDFDKFYRREEPADIMQFNLVKRKYIQNLREKIRSPDFQFNSKFTEAV